MQVIEKTIHEIWDLGPISIALGNFDGYHLGHISLLEELKKCPGKKAVVSFFPNPKYFIRNEFFSPLLSQSDKEKILREHDIDYEILLKTDQELIETSKEEFIQYLKKSNVQNIIVGEDYSFGYHGIGKSEDLLLEFPNTKILPLLEYKGEKISTTRIKEALIEGKIELANILLGRNYTLEGTVIHGSEKGRTLGFPTANLSSIEAYIPKTGVYMTKVFYQNQMYYGMLNIGHNPTINLQKVLRVEVHILDFSKEIYGESLKIELLKYLREEQKYSSKEELISVLTHDKQTIEKISKSEKKD